MTRLSGRNIPVEKSSSNTRSWSPVHKTPSPAFPKKPNAGARGSETHVCRHWAAATSGVQAMGFSRAGIGVFVVAALGFLGAGIGVFVVAALVFLSSGRHCFFLGENLEPRKKSGKTLSLYAAAAVGRPRANFPLYEYKLSSTQDGGLLAAARRRQPAPAPDRQTERAHRRS